MSNHSLRWTVLTDDEFDDLIESDAGAVVDNLTDAIRMIDRHPYRGKSYKESYTAHKWSSNGSLTYEAYMAQLVYIHYCFVTVTDNPSDLFCNFSVIMEVLREGFLSSFIDLLNDIEACGLTETQISILRKEVPPTKAAIKQIESSGVTTSVLKSLATSNNEVGKLASAILHEKSSDDTSCKVPKRFKSQNINVEERYAPTVSLNSAASLDDICVCTDSTLQHIQRLLIHSSH